MKFRVRFIDSNYIPVECFRYIIEHDNNGAPCYIQCFDESGEISAIINWVMIFCIFKIAK